MGEKKGPPKDDKTDKKKDKIAERLEAKLQEIEVKFFEQFPDDEAAGKTEAKADGQ